MPSENAVLALGNYLMVANIDKAAFIIQGDLTSDELGTPVFPDTFANEYEVARAAFNVRSW